MQNALCYRELAGSGSGARGVNDTTVWCQSAKLPQATFVTRAAARPTETLLAKKIDKNKRRKQWDFLAQ